MTRIDRHRRRHRAGSPRPRCSPARATRSRCSSSTPRSAAAPASWERDGFRFDTGPSWYLMPEVFDHFFRLLGTTAERAARPRAARPRLPGLRRGRRRRRSTSPPSVEENLELFERIEPGAAPQAREVPRPRARDLRPREGALPLLDVREARPGLRAARSRRRAARARCGCCSSRSTRSTEPHGARHRGCGRSSATRPCSSARRPTARRACTR